MLLTTLQAFSLTCFCAQLRISSLLYCKAWPQVDVIALETAVLLPQSRLELELQLPYQELLKPIFSGRSSLHRRLTPPLDESRLRVIIGTPFSGTRAPWYTVQQSFDSPQLQRADLHQTTCRSCHHNQRLLLSRSFAISHYTASRNTDGRQDTRPICSEIDTATIAAQYTAHIHVHADF